MKSYAVNVLHTRHCFDRKTANVCINRTTKVIDRVKTKMIDDGKQLLDEYLPEVASFHFESFASCLDP